MNERVTHTRHDGEEPRAPQKLVAALKEPPPRRVFVPPVIDDAVLNAARRHLTGPRRRKISAFRSLLMWPALATACVVLMGVSYLMIRQSGPPRFAREDLNHDGQVDILDAFQLAREIQNGVKPASALDLNGDGVVDQRDAEFIARRAVKLEKGGRS